MTLTDKHGRAQTSLKMCRDFSLGAARWAKIRHPEGDTELDLTNAGTVTVLKRLLKMLRRVLTPAEWADLELSWISGDKER